MRVFVSNLFPKVNKREGIVRKGHTPIWTAIPTNEPAYAPYMEAFWPGSKPLCNEMQPVAA